MEPPSIALIRPEVVRVAVAAIVKFKVWIEGKEYLTRHLPYGYLVFFLFVINSITESDF